MLDNLPDHPLRSGIARAPLFARGAPDGLAEPEIPWEEPPEPASGLAAARSQVVGLLDASPTAVDDLVRRCQFSPAAVMAVLLELELAGRVETLSGARVALMAP